MQACWLSGMTILTAESSDSITSSPPVVAHPITEPGCDHVNLGKQGENQGLPHGKPQKMPHCESGRELA